MTEQSVVPSVGSSSDPVESSVAGLNLQSSVPGTVSNTQVANKCDGKSLFAGAVFNSCVFNLNVPEK